MGILRRKMAPTTRGEVDGQGVGQDRLRAVVEHVSGWLLGSAEKPQITANQAADQGANHRAEIATAHLYCVESHQANRPAAPGNAERVRLSPNREIDAKRQNSSESYPRRH
jgi:hypothetical protein